MLLVLARAASTAEALRDQLQADGETAIGASVLATYLRQSLIWATRRLLDREIADSGWDGWFQPDPEEAQAAALRSYLKGD